VNLPNLLIRDVPISRDMAYEDMKTLGFERRLLRLEKSHIISNATFKRYQWKLFYNDGVIWEKSLEDEIYKASSCAKSQLPKGISHDVKLTADKLELLLERTDCNRDDFGEPEIKTSTETFIISQLLEEQGKLIQKIVQLTMDSNADEVILRCSALDGSELAKITVDGSLPAGKLSALVASAANLPVATQIVLPSGAMLRDQPVGMSVRQAIAQEPSEPTSVSSVSMAAPPAQTDPLDDQMQAQCDSKKRD